MGIDDQVQRKGYRNHTLSTLDQIRNRRIGVIRAGGEILFATYNGMLTNPVPVTEKVAVDMGPMNMLEFPKYRWHFYIIHGLAKPGLAVEDDDIVAGLVSVDIEDNPNDTKVSDTSMTLNWFAPQSRWFPGSRNCS